MRPTPDEVIAGIRAILKADVAPVVPKSAQVQLRRVMAVLRDARWNEAGFDLLKENAALTALALECATKIEQHDALRSALPEVGGMLRSAAAGGTPASFAEANEINHALRAALSGFMDQARDLRLDALDEIWQAMGPVLLQLRSM